MFSLNNYSSLCLTINSSGFDVSRQLPYCLRPSLTLRRAGIDAGQLAAALLRILIQGQTVLELRHCSTKLKKENQFLNSK